MPTEKTGLFATLFDNVQSLVALYNPARNTFEQVNKYGLRMFDVPDTDTFVSWFQSGRLWPDPPPDLSAYLAEIESTVLVQGYLEREMLYQTPGGKVFWGLLRIDSLDVRGERHLLIKITNIDELKNAAVSALQNMRQLQALFNNFTIGIVIVDRQGCITNFNPFAEQQFGYLKEEVLGLGVEILIPARFSEQHLQDRAAFAHQPQDRIMGAGRDLFARRKDGSEFPVEVSLSHYHIEDAQYVIACIVDISIRKKAQLALLKQKEALSQASAQVQTLNADLERKVEARTRMLQETLAELEKSREDLRAALEKEKELGELKSRFVTMASHEFRTPLSTILTSSYIIQQYTAADDQEKRDKHLVKIQNAVQNLTFILEDFLSLEKLEEGLVLVKLEVVNAKEMTAEIEGLIEEMKMILKQNQSVQFVPAALPALITDKKLLRNILVNLLSNAIKYSPEGSVIRITIGAENNNVKIAITDEGIGIPQADQKHLFERFFRASNAATIQGTGLGLHIVARYLQLIKGSIELRSEMGQGTSFTVSLPAKTSP